MSRQSEFENTAMTHLDAVYRAALALSGQPSLAEDLTQTTFLKAFEKFGSFKKNTNCKAWLMRILRNTWIDHLRSKKVAGNQLPLDEQLISSDTTDVETTWSDPKNLLENFSDDQVIKALAKLPDDQRLALFLTDVEEFTHQETADIMQVAVGTIKSRTSRARNALKNILSEYAKEMHLTQGNSDAS